MGILSEARRWVGEQFAGPEIALAQESARQSDASLSLLEERLAELELSLEDGGWIKLLAGADREFSREGLRKIHAVARVYWLKNPLIKQGVAIQTRYVFGQGVSIQARHPEAHKVVKAFLDDKGNQKVLTSHQARMIKETELQVFSNLFFVFFPNISTGKVKVRTIPEAEIDDIVCNPNDAAEPWYYKRVWTRVVWDPNSGRKLHTQEEAYYPDWNYKPDGGHPASIGGITVHRESPVYHVSVNRLSDMKFGVSEIYASQAWAKAYVDFLGDWATIVKAHSKFAWNLTTKGGTRGVQAAKTRLGTTMSSGGGAETNPPPAPGSTFVSTEGVKLEAVKTAGATTSADDGRRMGLMAGAGLGISEHYFGDPSTGNLATATSMERPMELMFIDRQKLWGSVFEAILTYVIEWSIRAPSGKLAKLGGQVTVDEDGEEAFVMPDDEETGEPIDLGVDVKFPPILEKDVLQTVQAYVTAATLDGKTPAGIDLKNITRMLLQVLGEPNVDELVDELFPEGWEEERAEKAASLAKIAQFKPEGDEPEDAVAEEVRKLAEAAQALADAAA